MTTKTGKRLNHLGKSIDTAALDSEKSKDEFLSETAFIEVAPNAAMDAFVVFDLKGRPLKWNRVVAEVTGYSDEELGSLNVMDVVAKEYRGDVAKTMEKTLKDGRAIMEVEVVSKNGDRIPLEFTGVLLKDKKDKPIGLCAIGRGIAERKKAEKELVESEPKFRTLFDNASDAIFIHDLEGHFVEVNEVAVERLGYSREELLSMTPTDIDSPEFAEFVPPRIKALQETGSSIFETAHVTRDGKLIPTEASSRIIEFQGQECILTIARDITERKRAEEALRASESKYRFMTENLNDVAWTVDLNMNTTYASPSIEKVLGFTPEERMRQRVDEQLTPESFELASKMLIEELQRDREEGVSQDRPVALELDFLHKDGHIVSLETIMSFIRDQDGGPVEIYGLSRDVTERKELEKTRRRLIHDLDKRVKELSALYELSRVIEKESTTIPEILEGTVHLIPPAWQYPEVTCARVTLGGGEFKTENFKETDWKQSADIVVQGRREGALEVYYLEERLDEGEGPFLSEEHILIEILAERLGRVVEHLRTEEELRGERDFIEVAINALQDAFYVLSVEGGGKLVRWNKKFSEASGYSDTELSDMTVFDFFDEEGKKGQQEFFLELFEKGRAGIEFDVVTKDGRRVPFHSQSTLVRDEEGNPLYVCGVARDITERKRAEEQLNETLDELSRSNAELEEFAYAASHDLQEPLRMVSSYVQLLERRYKDQLDSDADEFIGTAVDGVHRMQDLINDMLEYSRVGMRGKPFEPIDAGTALDKALDNLQVAIDESSALITSDGLPTVPADETQLIRLFQNLIGNAINFRGDDNPRIHISADRKANEYLFSIRDNGIGVDPSQSERIFQIFQRLHTRTERSGTGIGLAVCTRIVERHGGLIWVESEPGRGSTFFFTLPIRRNEEQ